MSSHYAHAKQFPSGVDIDLGERSYPILIGSLTPGCPGSFSDLPAARSALIVANTTVALLYGARLHAVLVPLIIRRSIPSSCRDGEAHKNWGNPNQIFDDLLEHACDCKTTLFALGGGVIGDMTVLQRPAICGGSFVQVPTTLLSSSGSIRWGKTGVNHPKGKT